MQKLLEKIYHIHDVECNQKYAKNLPYSFHLKMVVEQVKKYFYPCFSIYLSDSLLNKLIIAGAGHDLIEDCRFTYNDVNTFIDVEYNMSSENLIGDIIYACTEEKGKNREERHSQKFFDELKKNRLAVFVKLCDIMANVLYSMLTNSFMYEKYKKEFPNLKTQLYIEEEYKELWKDLEKLLC